MWEDSAGSVQSAQRRDLVRTHVERLHDWMGRIHPCWNILSPVIFRVEPSHLVLPFHSLPLSPG